MHAAAQWTSLSWLFAGGKVVLMPGSLDPARGVADRRARGGQHRSPSSATPWPGRCSTPGTEHGALRRLLALSRSVERRRAAWPRPPARRDLRRSLPHVMHHRRVRVVGDRRPGRQRVEAGERPEGASLVRFNVPTKPTIVVGPDGDEVEPGSGVIGRVLAGGRHPARLLQRPRARRPRRSSRSTASAGSLTGDMATVDADGTIQLLGRGSQCINTGGEKVFPEEVEARPQGAPRRVRRASWSACPTSAGGARSPRSCSRRRRRGRRSRSWRPTPGDARRLQGSQARGARRAGCSGRRPARPTTAGPRPPRSRRSVRPRSSRPATGPTGAPGTACRRPAATRPARRRAPGR